MAQYQFYSSSKESASMERCPVACIVPEYCPEEPLPSYNQNSAIPFEIDYSYFINEISSKRQSSRLREISNCNTVIDVTMLVWEFMMERFER